jgi:CBS domain-containing protein
MTVGKFCNRDVVIIERGGSVQQVAELMRNEHVGAVVVIEDREGKRFPVGVLTDRDIVVELIAKQVPLDSVLVGDVMSFDLVTAREEDSLTDTLRRMRLKGVRRMPVVDEEGALAGILTVDDVLEVLADEFMEAVRVITREQHRERETRGI